MSHIQLPRLSRIAIAAAASAALIGTAFIAPATAFAAPSTGNAAVAAAANDAAQTSNAFYTDPTGSTQGVTDTVTGGTYTHLTQLVANGDLTSASNVAGKGNSILVPEALTQLRMHGVYTNNTANPIKVNQLINLPKNYAGANAPMVDPSGFDANGLKASNVNVPGATLLYAQKSGTTKPYADLTAAGFGPQDVLQIQISGTLAAGATWSIDVPLQVPAASTAGTSFRFGELIAAPGTATTFLGGDSTVSLATPLKNSAGASVIPFAGKLLPITKAADGSYSALPKSVASLMPDAANGTNYWVNNFAKSTVAGSTQSALFNNGWYTVDASEAVAALNTHGYDATLNTDGTKVTSITRQAATKAVTINASADGTTAQTTDHDAATFQVRQVVAGKDGTIAAHTTLDAASTLGLAVYDHAGKTVALNSADVKVDTSKVNANAAGTYPVTVTYTPDGVSNTFNVTVTAVAVTPGTPTLSDDGTLTIPTTTGVTYQADGKDLTGDQKLTPGQKITVKAIAADTGYVLADDATASWDFTYIATATPAEPTLADDGTLTIPATDGVAYQVDGKAVTGDQKLTPGQKITVKATANTGYKLADGATASWDFTYIASATPVEPTISGDTVTIPVVTGIDYQIDGKTVTGTITLDPGQKITVTAIAQAGYAIPEGAAYSWDITNTTVTPVATATAAPTESASGAQVKTSGTGSAADLAGLGIALAAAGAGAAAAARTIRRNRR